MVPQEVSDFSLGHKERVQGMRFPRMQRGERRVPVLVGTQDE